MAKKRTHRKSEVQSGHRGTLILIGGHEDKDGDRLILKEVVKRLKGGKLVVTTVASSCADEVWETYRRTFRELGAGEVEHLQVDRRDQSFLSKNIGMLNGAKGFFFSGGDQLRITSELDGTELVEAIHAIYTGGGVVAGTSAGASVMGENMLISGKSDASYRHESIRMAPGLGFVRNVLIDQHFAERGRIGRLLGAVSRSPRNLGVGIDENTAIIVEGEECFHVVGAGDAYVIDAHGATESNVSEENSETALSMFNVKLHILCHGDRFDLKTGVPSRKKVTAAAN